MKKILFLSAVATMMLAACSNNDEVTPQVGPGQDAPSITIAINSAGDQTRAARPVNSSEAANTVTQVKLVVYDATGANVTATVLNAANSTLTWTASTTPTPALTGTSTSQEVTFISGALANGTYTVVGYGYNAAADFGTITPPATFTTAENAFTATPATAAAPAELFAGSLTMTVSNGDITSASTLTMKRQIAGMLGYFKNIPVNYPNEAGVPTAVQYVRVLAAAGATSFTFPSTVANAVNGIIPIAGPVTLLDLDLSALIDNYAGQVAVTPAIAGDIFEDPAVNTADLVTEANSILGGRFVVPFGLVASTPTLKIQLVAQNGTTVLKEWNVKNASDVTAFNIERNAFYSLGQKLKAASTNGITDPTTPGDITDPTTGIGDPDATDDDMPIDLSISTDITVTVNDAWDAIYQLGLE